MNNELGRKITSLTLMTIMLAGGMTFAAPSMMPVAHAANANLFVSAENSQFDNYMSGPQVIEVVVIDSDINDTDEAKGEPDVTVNGKIMRMVQAVDGNWYGYFADRVMATTADATSAEPGIGLDFGTVCTVAADIELAGTAIGSATDFFSDTNGIAVGGTDCSVTGADPTIQNVLREAKDLNLTIPGGGLGGQIGIADGTWPFIQLYTLNPTGNVVVQYNKGGGVQTTTLTFDTVDQFASASLDRAVYTPGSQVHATITDLWLNIDPTDEDSWTFGTTGTDNENAASTNYQVFNENGIAVGDVLSNTDDNLLTDALGSLMCEDNCRLITNADVQKKGDVITLQDNDDSEIANAIVGRSGTGSDQDPTAWNTVNGFLDNGAGIGFVPVTITEQGPNSGVFGSYDESDQSAIVITKNALRGTSASITYNEDSVSILVGLSFGSIDIKPIDEEWTSGEEIPVELTDNDANQNSRADEDLDLNNPVVKLIPSLQTGDPLTLDDATSIELDNVDVLDRVQAFSDRAILSSDSIITVDPGDDLFLTIGTFGDFFDAAPVNDADFHGFALFNYDVRSLSDNLPDLDSLDIDINGVNIATATTDNQDLILLTGSDFAGFGTGDDVEVTFNINMGASNNIPAGTELPIVVDVFGFGFLNDGLEDDERIANQIIRLELEETGDNTGIFAGTLEYTMINQLNILDADTYENLSTISNEATFIVIEDLDD
ncbi:MAG: hypothetical protein OEX98_06425, partial [Nitrosopumilus sp.]|nr:hypothetical protein [Nitrosopumilus sp.]